MILFTAVKCFVGLAVRTLKDAFINSFFNWLKKMPELLESQIEGVLIGHKSFVGKENSLQGYEKSKNYSLLGDQWYVTTATRTVGLDEIPSEILGHSEIAEDIDVTQELEMALQ